MTTIEEWAAALTSYAAAGLALLATHSGGIISFFGFILLIARLVQEIPAAYRTIMGKKTKKHDDKEGTGD